MTHAHTRCFACEREWRACACACACAYVCVSVLGWSEDCVSAQGEFDGSWLGLKAARTNLSGGEPLSLVVCTWAVQLTALSGENGIAASRIDA